MPTIYVIRHGKAAAGWDADKDPGLDATGQAQAEAAAVEIARRTGSPLPLVSSPLKRCRETAVPLASAWSLVPAIEPRVAEIPSPIDDVAARVGWLRKTMSGTWAEATSAEANADHLHFVQTLLDWRRNLAEAVLELTQDTIIFSHFIAVNVLVGHAQKDDRVTIFQPDNCSVNIFNTDGGVLSVVELGREASTRVN
ncbi:MAG: phosphoglycerate mutase family protein [Parvibaculaceae bacterium]|nr:phosphoglycerate mutase family protein [Parvibaculaceae bacterium]